jgi:hypothetical protein
MSNKKSLKTLPAYRVYSVARNGDKKAVWQEIGAAWKHKDSKGFNLQFNALPLEGAQIVLREPTAKKTGVKPSGQALGRYDELSTQA